MSRYRVYIYSASVLLTMIQIELVCMQKRMRTVKVCFFAYVLVCTGRLLWSWFSGETLHTPGAL